MEENEAELASLGLAEAPKGKKQKLAAKGKGGPAAKPIKKPKKSIKPKKTRAQPQRKAAEAAAPKILEEEEGEYE